MPKISNLGARRRFDHYKANLEQQIRRIRASTRRTIHSGIGADQLMSSKPRGRPMNAYSELEDKPSRGPDLPQEEWALQAARWLCEATLHVTTIDPTGSIRTCVTTCAEHAFAEPFPLPTPL